MSKIGRNQPCPCGSGKKYKKCCGKTENLSDFKTNIFEQKIDHMLSLIFEDLSKNLKRLPGILWAMLGDELQKRPQLAKKIEEISDDPEEVFDDAELMPLVDCLIFDFPFFDGNTLFEKHFNCEKKGFRTFVIDNFSLWRDSYVSIYQVQQVGIDGKTLKVKDIFINTEAVITTENLNMEDVHLNDLLVTRLLSKGNGYGIIGCTILPGLVKDQIKEFFRELKRKKIKSGNRAEDWIKFLKQYGYLVLINSIELINRLNHDDYEELHFQHFKESLHWLDAKQYQVALLIEEKLRLDYPFDLVAMGLKLWNLYCQEMSPRITKVETLAASIEYVISLVTGEHRTQREIAEKYGVSISSISSRYSEMLDMLSHLANTAPEEDEFVPRHLAERNLFEIENYLELNNFEIGDSTEDFNNFIQNNYEKILEKNKSEGSNRYKAQALLYDAWNQRDVIKRINMAKEALSIYPYSADAFNILAEDEAKSVDERIVLYQRGIEAGQLDLGEQEFLKLKGHFWGNVKTRPYMRAKQGLVSSLIYKGEFDEAITHCEDMLELNPVDNQGNRYLLLSLYLRTNRLSKASELMKKYDEQTAEFMYNKVILEYKLSGPGLKVKKALEKAIEYNPYVAEYLLGNKEIPEDSPNYYGLGDQNEAIIYIQNNLLLWQENPEIIKWLIKNLSSIM